MNNCIHKREHGNWFTSEMSSLLKMEISSLFFLFQSNILTFQRWQLGQCNSNEYHETCWDFSLSFVFSRENNFVVDVEAFATQTMGAVLPIVCTKVYLGTYFKPELCDCAVAPCSCILNVLLPGAPRQKSFLGP